MAIQTQLMTTSGQDFTLQFERTEYYIEQIIKPLIGELEPHNNSFGLIGIHQSALERIEAIEVANYGLREQVEELEVTLNQGTGIYVEEVYNLISEDLESYKDFVGTFDEGTGTEAHLSHMKSVLENNLQILIAIEPTAINVQGIVETLPSSWLQLSTGDMERYNQQLVCLITYTNIIQIDSNAIELTPYSQVSILSDIEAIKAELISYQTDIVFDYNQMSYVGEQLSIEGIKSILEKELDLDIPDIASVIDDSNLPSVNRQATDNPSAIPEGLDLGASIATYEWLAQVSDYFKNGTEELLGDIYLNGYILGMFNHGTSDGENEAGDRIGINNIDMGDHQYDYEIEYILFGNQELYKNVLATTGIIFAIRVLLNTIHILSSPSKLSTMTDMANIIAGWWSLGIGTIPVVALLTFIWTCIESSIDIYQLFKGEKVPLLKNETNWSADLDSLLGIALEEPSVADVIEDTYSFGYEDYLRLMLYLPITSKEDKLFRIMDLIQINMSDGRDEVVVLDNYIHDIKTSADIEVNWLFFDLPFMPNSISGLVGSKHFEVESYQCYQ
ncbi:MAG: DUF5702 domain-containing protein [Vallitaleaceae bacterium]|jgi:hypothetical protein|nr:DUF5702 domain-containing protein [Vallitaleaceae bacterium]